MRSLAATMRGTALLAGLTPLATAQQAACPGYNFVGVTNAGTQSKDWLDAFAGLDSCNQLLATGQLTCATTFGPGSPQAGNCDYTCHFCTPVELVLPARPPCAAYSPSGGQTSNDYYDSWEPGSCAALLAQDKTACATILSPTGSMANFCDSTCGYCAPPRRQTSANIANIASAAQQCRSDKCAPTAPVWSRLAGPSHTCTIDNYWANPADCVAWVNSNVDQNIDVPSMLPFSQTAYRVDTTNCGAVVANWAIDFGLSSLAECLQRCDLPGCESTDVAAGCHPAASHPATGHHPALASKPAAPATTMDLRKVAACVLVVAALAGVGVKTKAGRKQGKQPRGELGDSIYTDESL